MPASLTPFADVELGVMIGLEDKFVDLEQGDVATVTPSNLGYRLSQGRRFVRVGRVTGNDDRITDVAVVDIDVFGASRQVARDLAEGIRAWLLGYPLTAGSLIVDRVFTETAPTRAPWEDENVHRYLATYRISSRRS